MKYRDPYYREKQSSCSQTFVPLVKDYRLNEHTNELVETGTFTNIQEKIQSALESTFDKILQKLMPGEVIDETNESVKTLARMQDKLDLMSEAYNVAEAYRSKYHLSDEMSVSDIFNYVTNQAKELANIINSKQKDNKVAELEKVIADAQAKLNEVQNV